MNPGLCILKNSFPTSCLEGRFNICQSWGFEKPGWEKMLKNLFAACQWLGFHPDQWYWCCLGCSPVSWGARVRLFWGCFFFWRVGEGCKPRGTEGVSVYQQCWHTNVCPFGLAGGREMCAVRLAVKDLLHWWRTISLWNSPTGINETETNLRNL